MCGLHMIMLFWNTHQELKKSSSKNTEGHKFNQINILFLEKLKDFTFWFC